MLSVEIIVPEFEFKVVNEEEVIRAMADYELAAVRRRVRQGVGSRGSLPRPKSGGMPLNRSGQLANSIEAIIDRRGKTLGARIEPTGQRSEAKERAASRRRRVAEAKKTGDTTTIARVRSRTNMAVAAILAYPAKDKRAKGRGTYVVFRATEGEKKDLRRIAAETARCALVEKGSGASYEGRGE